MRIPDGNLMRVLFLAVGEGVRFLPMTAPQLPDYDYLRARALTHLGRRLEVRTNTRVCIGGRLRQSQGRCPGVIEEALLCLSARKPLYLVGLLGGATRRLIDAIERRSMPSDFFERAPVADKYKYPPPSALESSPATAADRTVMSAAEVWSRFQNAGLEELSRSNDLTAGQNRELFERPAINRAIRLVLLGLSRVCQQPS